MKPVKLEIIKNGTVLYAVEHTAILCINNRVYLTPVSTVYDSWYSLDNGYFMGDIVDNTARLSKVDLEYYQEMARLDEVEKLWFQSLTENHTGE